MRMVNAAEYDEYQRFLKSEAWLGAVRGEKSNDGPQALVRFQSSELECVVDTGSPINIIDLHAYGKLSNKPELHKPTTNFYGYNATNPLPVHGAFTTDVEYGNRSVRASFIVLDGYAQSLLSYKTATELDIIQLDKAVRVEAKVKRKPEQTDEIANGAERACSYSAPTSRRKWEYGDAKSWLETKAEARTAGLVEQRVKSIGEVRLSTQDRMARFKREGESRDRVAKETPGLRTRPQRVVEAVAAANKPRDQHTQAPWNAASHVMHQSERDKGVV
jgi:hypothetical protein